MDSVNFLVRATFVFLSVSVLFMAMSYYSDTARKKWFWGWNAIIALSFFMAIVLNIQKKFLLICSFQNYHWLLYLSSYGPYILWLLSFWFFRKATLARKKDDLHNTHYQFNYAFGLIILAAIFPIINIGLTFWGLKK